MGGSTLGTTQEMKQINAIGAFMTSVSQEQTGFLLAWETEDYFLDYVHSKKKKKRDFLCLLQQTRGIQP